MLKSKRKQDLNGLFQRGYHVLIIKVLGVLETHVYLVSLKPQRNPICILSGVDQLFHIDFVHVLVRIAVDWCVIHCSDDEYNPEFNG